MDHERDPVGGDRPRKKTKNLNNAAIFYNLNPWYAEKDAGNFSKTSKSVTDGIAGSSKNKAGIYYAELKKYIKNKEKKKTKKSFVTVTSGDSGKKYDICNYSYFANLSTADIKEIIGFKGNSFTSDGQKKLARARQLYSSIANINETSTGQYTTTPEMADVFCAIQQQPALAAIPTAPACSQRTVSKRDCTENRKG